MAGATLLLLLLATQALAFFPSFTINKTAIDINVRERTNGIIDLQLSKAHKIGAGVVGAGLLGAGLAKWLLRSKVNRARGSGPIYDGEDHHDCTASFNGKLAMLEYRYYPGYWLYPFNKMGQYLAALQPSTLREARTDTVLQWIIHSCGQATVCLEARRPGWGSYWLQLEDDTAKMRFRAMRYDVIHQHNSPFKFKILCQACFPKEAIYHDCHIYNVAAESFLITNQHGFATGHSGGEAIIHRARRSTESLTWFSWRIVAPPTKAYWETVGDISNCRGEEELEASMVLWSTITHTTLGIWGQAEREEGGFLAIALLEETQEGRAHDYTWTAAELRLWAQGRKVVLGAGTPHKVVKPGWRWQVRQWVGEAAFAKLTTKKYESLDIPCREQLEAPGEDQHTVVHHNQLRALPQAQVDFLRLFDPSYNPDRQDGGSRQLEVVGEVGGEVVGQHHISDHVDDAHDWQPCDTVERAKWYEWYTLWRDRLGPDAHHCPPRRSGGGGVFG